MSFDKKNEKWNQRKINNWTLLQHTGNFFFLKTFPHFLVIFYL